MLLQLNIKNLATLASVDLNLTKGYIAITGDTGAGKSLILDALELALGARADASLVRAGTDRAQITALFDIENMLSVKKWLRASELDTDGDLILRRTLSSEGRSKAYVNGTLISTSQLKELSEKLVLMHTQHANHKLLQSHHQLELIDDFADQGQARQIFHTAYRAWSNTLSALDLLKNDASKAQSERELLGFQVEELNACQLDSGEFEKLDREQRQLASGDAFIQVTDQALNDLTNEENGGLIGNSERLANQLSDICSDQAGLTNASELLGQAAIAFHEAKIEIQYARNQFELDPERLRFVEDRLTQIFSLARKHKVEPDQLAAHHSALSLRLEGIAQASNRIPQLEQQLAEFKKVMQDTAMQLKEKRTQAAKNLSTQVTRHFPALGMEYASLEIRLINRDVIASSGAETIEFFFQPNPGQQGGSLSRIASGGELSRVNLAIQVITATRSATPTLVFDEVDVGIGGKTAAKVGELLTELAINAQVLVITHQPQVAAQANQHLHVHKQSAADITVSEARLLSQSERIEEIARMVGGHTVTESARQTAEELLRPPNIDQVS